MRLTIYDQSNTQARPHCNEEWAISIGMVDGIFNLSSGLRKGLKLKADDKVLLACDEQGNWFIAFCDEPSGFTLRIGNHTRKYPNLVFSCKTIGRKICEEVGASVSAKFLVSHKAVNIDGRIYYQIMTKRPLRK